MKTLIRPALTLFVLLSVMTGLIYPLLVTGISQALFPAEAAGSLILREGKPVGSRLIGQNFTDPKYFWGRPSATGPYPVSYTHLDVYKRQRKLWRWDRLLRRKPLK